jgi:vacuolar-type H+-ATPase subunit I/STV1
MAGQTSADWARGRSEEEPSSWAIGGAIFAAVMMMIIGLFHVFTGLIAIIRDKFYVVTPNYILNFNITGWGWIHLITGAVLVIAGLYVLTGRLWARIIGIFFVSLSAIANFLFIPFYPFWALLMIALDVFVIWSLAAYSSRRTAAY